MFMKNILLTLTLALFALPAFGGGGVDYGSIQARPFGYVLTSDFDDDWDWGAGLGLAWLPTEFAGLETEILARNTHGKAIDAQTANVIGVWPLSGKVTLKPFGGIVRSYEDAVWGFNIGGRLSYKFTETFDASAGARWLRMDGGESQAMFTAGLGVSF